MEMQYNLSQDLREAQYMASALEPYVRQDELYFNLGGGLPSMTLGGFLLRSRRLHLFQDRLKPDEVIILYDIEDAHREALQEWHYHYTKKLVTEAASRLDVIEYYLTECEENRADCRDNYNPEALRRTLVQELLHAINHLDIEDQSVIERKASDVDERLRPMLEPTEFLWDKDLKPAYPANTFWWLYGQPTNMSSDRRQLEKSSVNHH